MSLNKVFLIGNAGRDPEVRYLDANGTQGSTKIARFTLATSERYKDRNGEMRENTEWHNIVAWRQNADVIEKFVRKGTPLFIEGKLTTRSWTDAQGVKKSTTEITVDNMQLLGRRPEGQEGGYAAPAAAAAPQYGAPATPQYSAPAPQYQAPAPAASAPEVPEITVDDPSDDLPF